MFNKLSSALLPQKIIPTLPDEKPTGTYLTLSCIML